MKGNAICHTLLKDYLRLEVERLLVLLLLLPLDFLLGAAAVVPMSPSRCLCIFKMLD